jgi:hypothetical protein
MSMALSLDSLLSVGKENSGWAGWVAAEAVGRAGGLQNYPLSYYHAAHPLRRSTVYFAHYDAIRNA